MKKSLLLLLCAMFLMAPLFAEDAPFSSKVQTGSQGYYASSGIFEGDADYFLDTANYGMLDEKGIFLLGGNSSNAEFGYGTFLNGLYIGTYYKGYVLDMSNTYGGDQTLLTQTETTPIFDDNYNLIGQQQDTAIYQSKDSWSSTPTGNRFDLLEENTGAIMIGVGSVGIQLAVEQSVSEMTGPFRDGSNNLPDMWTWELSDSDYNRAIETTSELTDADGNMISYSKMTEDGEIKDNQLIPSLSVGTTIETDAITVKPRFSFAYEMNTESYSSEYESYTQKADQGTTLAGMDNVTAYESQEYTKVTQKNALDADISAEFVKTSDASEWNFGVGYGFWMGMYSSPYDNLSGSEKTASGYATSYSSSEYEIDPNSTGNGYESETVDTISYVMEDTTDMVHTIPLLVKYTKDVDSRLTMGTKFLANVTLASYTAERSGEEEVTTVYTDALDTSNGYTQVRTTTFTDQEFEYSSLKVDPSLSFGMRYELIPGRLAISGGATYVLPAYQKTSSEKTVPEYSEETTVTTNNDGSSSEKTSYDIENSYSEFESVTTDWDAASYSFTGGMTLNFTEDIYLDLLMDTNGQELKASEFTAQFVIRK